MPILPLRAALRRGALLVAANWPIVLIDFGASALYRLALSVPVLGGCLVVAAILGADPRAIVGEGVHATADNVVGALATAPVALTAFLMALALVAMGGEAISFVVRNGTFSVVVRADRECGSDVHQLPIGAEVFEQASRYELRTVLAGATHFARRGVQLALWLGAGYVVVGVGYVMLVTAGPERGLFGWLPAGPLLVAILTGVSAIVIALARLLSDLLRVVIVTDDCSVREAAGRFRRFAIDDARQVIGIFAVMGAVQVLAATVALFAAGGLAIVAYVPLVSLVFVPLQAAAWVLRGLFFEAVELAALAAYQTQYRRYSQARVAAEARQQTGDSGPIG